MGTRDFSHWPRNSSTDNDRPISVNSCKIFLIVTGHLCGPLRANFDYDQKGEKKRALSRSFVYETFVSPRTGRSPPTILVFFLKTGTSMNFAYCAAHGADVFACADIKVAI